MKKPKKIKKPIYSTNALAEKIVGKREPLINAIPFDQPCELGFHCPVCKYDLVTKEGEFDERLQWSEYNSFLWCRKCDKDFPSALCQPNIDKAIDTYLHAVHEAQLRAVATHIIKTTPVAP